MEASHGANILAARLLLDAGARTDACDRVGWTPLHFAAQNERAFDILKMLIAADADVDRPDYGGTTPLMIAAAYNNPRSRRRTQTCERSLGLLSGLRRPDGAHAAREVHLPC